MLIDNLTTIIGAFGFALCVFLALAPAIRPRRLAGRMLVVAAVVPLLIYDLTLLGNLFGETLLYRIAKHIVIGYPAYGWGLAAFGFLAVALRHRIGGLRNWLLAAAVGIACLAAMLSFPSEVFRIEQAEQVASHNVTRVGSDGALHTTASPLTPAEIKQNTLNQEFLLIPSRDWAAVFGILFVLLVALAGRLIMAPVPEQRMWWQVLRLTLYLGVVGLTAGLIWVQGMEVPTEMLPLYCIVAPLVLACLWLFAEVSLWRLRRQHQRQTGKAGAPVMAAEAVG